MRKTRICINCENYDNSCVVSCYYDWLLRCTGLTTPKNEEIKHLIPDRCPYKLEHLVLEDI